MEVEIPLKKNYIIILMFSVFLISFSILTLEITLTRIFSVIYSHHFSFLAISIAMFGLGLGGIFTRVVSIYTDIKEIFIGLALISFFISFSIFICTILVLINNLNPIYNGFIMFIPFFISGIFLASIYKIFAKLCNVIYFFDLFGASIGCLITIFFLSKFGAINTVFLISIVLSIVSLLFIFVSKKRKFIIIETASVFILILSIQYFSTSSIVNVPVGSESVKVLYNAINDPTIGAKIVDSRWSAFGRTDLVEFRGYQDFKIIFLDGSAGTVMLRFNGNFSENNEILMLKNSTAYFPLYFVNKNRALIIGPGGGVDIVMALMAGIKNITAVEVNPEIVDIVIDYSDFNGGIYTEYKNIDVFIDEGRSYIRRNNLKYDVIMLNLPVTRTSQGISGYSLVENYLFTTNSFEDYFNHLEENGFLVIVAHSRMEIEKLISITIKFLEKREENINEIMRHVIITEQLIGNPLPVFIFKKSPFSTEEQIEIYERTKVLNLLPYFIPDLKVEGLSSYISDLSEGKISLNNLISLLPYDISPPTDDSPFYYKFKKGVPATFLNPLVGSITLSIFILFLYFINRKRRISARASKKIKLKRNFLIFWLYYFSSIGLGFMLIEISLIQKFMLFIGQPTYTMSIFLFSLLFSSSIGGFLSNKIQNDTLTPPLKYILIIGILVIIYLFILNPIFMEFLIYPLYIRYLISFILLFPLGLFMGIPFSSGIKILKKENQREISWMWCFNSTYSLAGSILAVIIGMSMGFNAAFLLGGFLYILIFIIGYIKFKKK